ncbi:hypothetical protein FH972_022342 [Carpinus fangiana]|uniref:Uncharacterized protein n=1 Tax=Carpinus fangiana TaxID=176857 RepID=A0A5N6KS03_9ROSI|nr:hypothetical protein FH972_022342 [Carpinus fangiana]
MMLAPLDKHVPSDLARQANQRELQRPEEQPVQPALTTILVAARVPGRVHKAADAPAQAQRGSEHGVLEPGNQQRGDEGAVVLEVVGVGALGAVEEVLLLGERGARVLGVGGHGVGRGVRAVRAGGLAVAADAGAVPEGEGEGDGCGEHDVAVARLRC